MPAITETFSYAEALYTYYSHNNNELKDCYLRLVSNSSETEFLCSNIELCLWEKTFRENGISEELIGKYNSSLEEYKKQLVFNNELYGKQQSSGRKL